MKQLVFGLGNLELGGKANRSNCRELEVGSSGQMRGPRLAEFLGVNKEGRSKAGGARNLERPPRSVCFILEALGTIQQRHSWKLKPESLLMT